MNFGQALEAAKGGAKIYRDGWNGKGQFVIAIPGTSNVLPREGTPYADLDISPLGVVDIAPHLDLKNAQGHMQPGWVPSMGDLFANDWGATPHEPKDMGEVSDGYHTFNELYAHRVRLFTTLMRAHPDKSWFSHRNHEGIGEEGWILAGIDTPAGTVTYHLPVSEIPNLPPTFALDYGKEWDGHTPDDVLVRLLSLDGVSTSGLLPHQQRVTDELQELQGRLDKLTGFIAGDAFSTLPEQDQRLLEAQSHIMSAYVEVLTQRTKRF
ncbi:Protein of uncharacterised function (DUF2829) [Serratia fonticola]|uniref:DUF2829 domain-containing protein n=1 Tax=Serratia fonticola TaxID=47917 RepID=UPI002182A6FD|nr:DUF2829 domain-containing protein [Serratia fonticola]CAI2145751.1 Protein of uncharacterised function (DUF2829) [Serratia fonticola]